MGLNKCAFIGNLGKDLEVKQFENGDKVGRVSLAVTESWKNDKGEKQEKTTWIPLLVPDFLMEHAPKLLTKGRKLYVEGKYQPRDYMDGDQKKTIHEFRISEYQLLDGPKKDTKAEAPEEEMAHA